LLSLATRRKMLIYLLSYLGKKMVNLEERTVDKYLKKLLTAGYLIQDNYGKYIKKI